MSAAHYIAFGAVAAGLFFYLVLAMLNPERFS